MDHRQQVPGPDSILVSQSGWVNGLAVVSMEILSALFQPSQCYFPLIATCSFPNYSGWIIVCEEITYLQIKATGSF